MEVVNFPGKEKQPEQTVDFWTCGECGGALFYVFDHGIECAECRTEVENVKVLPATPDAD